LAASSRRRARPEAEPQTSREDIQVRFRKSDGNKDDIISDLHREGVNGMSSKRTVRGRGVTSSCRAKTNRDTGAMMKMLPCMATALAMILTEPTAQAKVSRLEITLNYTGGILAVRRTRTWCTSISPLIESNSRVPRTASSQIRSKTFGPPFWCATPQDGVSIRHFRDRRRWIGEVHFRRQHPEPSYR
jgi:hypothetical protein